MEINEKKKKKEQQELIIRKYQQYLKLEKSLSPNTLEAYLTDLDKLMSFLTLEGINVLEVCLSDLQRFTAGLHDIGIHPRSQARILSGIKSFFRFLLMADYLEADPSELLEGPKIGFKLPEVLTVEEIDRIISAVDRSKAEGQRNRAILETLYSCGLRVSELVNLKLSDLYFDEGFIKVEGKGSKQRLVPISPRAINEIKLYFTDRNRIEVKKEYEDFVFVSQRRGKGLLCSEKGLKHRGQRCIEPEAVFGQIKNNMNYKRFRHFGKDKVFMDFAFLAIAFNIKKMCAKLTKEGMNWLIGWFYELTVALFRCWRHINQRNLRIIAA